MRSFAAPFLENRILTALTLSLVIALGLWAITALPRQEDPVPLERFGIINVPYPGASAERVEALIAEKIETKVRELDEVEEIKSTSRTGMATITIELQDWVTDTDEVWSKLRDRVSEVEPLLPAEAASPRIEVQKLPAETLILALVPEGESGVSLGLAGRIAEDLATKLRNVPGTERVEIYGEPEEEILVSVDSNRLASAGLAPEDVARALALADSKAPAGQLRSSANSILVEVGGAFDSLQRVRNVPLVTRPGARTLTVGDVASVEKAVRQPAATEAIFDGHQGIGISVLMLEKQRVDLWTGAARQVISEFEETLPRGLRLRILVDQSVYTQDRLETLGINFLSAVVLVVGILFFILGRRAALLVGVSLPLTVFLTLGAMLVLGVPLHQMSITGIIIALGILIDNGIVSVDEYLQARRRGLGIAESVSHTSRHIALPLATSTFTSLLTFAPIVLLTGAIGDFIGTMGLTVILALGFSFVVAITLLPALTGAYDARLRRRGSPADMTAARAYPKIGALHSRIAATALAKPLASLAAAVLVAALGYAASGLLTAQFFPPVERDQFQVQVAMPPTATAEETARTTARIDRVFADYPQIVGSSWHVGESAPKVFYNVVLQRDGLPSFAAGVVQTRSAEATRDILPDLQRRLLRDIPEAEVLTLPFEQGPPVDAPVQVRLVGPNFDTLRTVGEDIRAILAASENVTYARASAGNGRPKLVYALDEEAVRMAGLTLAEVSAQISSQIEGGTGGSIVEGTEELQVRIRVGDADRSDAAAFSSRTLATGEAGAGLVGVPLSALGKPQLVVEDDRIERRNQERVNTIEAFILPYELPSVTLADFRERLDSSGLVIPPGYRLEFGGDSEASGKAVSSLFSSVAVLVILMVGAIILAFNSVTLTAILVGVAILSGGYAMLTLLAFGQPLGFMAIVGIMALKGVAVNGAIMVLANLEADPAAKAGDAGAAHRVVLDNSRHILGTTLTTVAGFVPLILFADDFWRPLSFAVAGGVVGSSILALYVVPGLHQLCARRRCNRAPEAAPVKALAVAAE